MSPGDKLLARAPRQEFDVIAPHLERVGLPVRQSLHEPLEPIAFVYFLESGVCSLVNEPETGEIVEFASVGNEGMVRFPILLGAAAVPSRALIQIPGAGYRMSAAALQRALPRTPELQKLLLRHTLALLTRIAQTATCNRLHDVQERCARWLLQTRDRVEADNFPLTQEFLAQMLGVHRPSVTVAAAALQKAGLIRYSRGQIAVLDRRGLEAASCSCYRTIRAEYHRFLDAV